MQTSLEYIQDHIQEFVWCRNCCCFNSIENIECHNCGSTDLTTDIQQKIEDELDYNANCTGLEPQEALYQIK
jgi:hypothetical protein